MTDKKRRAFLQIEHPVGSGDIVGERRNRLLHDRDIETALDEDIGCLAPARTVGKCAMDNDDVFDFRGLRAAKAMMLVAKASARIGMACRFMRFTPVVVGALNEKIGSQPKVKA